MAALGVSLAMGLLVGGLVLRAVAALKLARADYRQAQAEYALAGAQLLAATKVLGDSGNGRLAWRAGAADGQAVDILAEPEREKLGLGGAGSFNDRTLEALGADDVGETRSRLAGLDPKIATPTDIRSVASTPVWRACAASAISPWGTEKALVLHAPREPSAPAAGMRAGEVWRISATTDDGWVDDRVVRLVGRRDLPAATIWRQFGRASHVGVSCDKIIDQ